ncbi:hypothetical protein CERZMDRAFT_34331 [Cercospora zeae-maydis SCOH1-5]|uniref:Ketoreductase (KR) domain-containing protein n=1 Tax=Cercospora zeae-maydis SCOH1-5 TaxID=717836 RepID=A0A6A6FQP7_9PEZI|nr:hypothetical protein CERZMDRAFT_34331 [Cercospora zeae-maydis SCOH1-5]
MGSVAHHGHAPEDVSPAGALVLFGSGPVLGAHVAAMFAQKGFHKIVLLSRNLARLQEDAAFVRQAAPQTIVETVTVDLADVDSVRAAIGEVEARLHGTPLELVIYNAARTVLTQMLQLPVHEVQADINISAGSLYVVAQWAHPLLAVAAERPGFRPAILVTGGKGWEDPPPKFFSLATSKGAQRTLSWAMHKAFAPTGVHVSYISIGGPINNDVALTQPGYVALEVWKEFAQPRGPGHWERAMVDPSYAPYKAQEHAAWHAAVAACPRWRGKQVVMPERHND